MVTLTYMPTEHVPVLAAEVIRETDPRPGETVVDCTFGGGGHSRRRARGARRAGRDRERRVPILGKAYQVGHSRVRAQYGVIELRVTVLIGDLQDEVAIPLLLHPIHDLDHAGAHCLLVAEALVLPPVEEREDDHRA